VILDFKDGMTVQLSERWFTGQRGGKGKSRIVPRNQRELGGGKRRCWGKRGLGPKIPREGRESTQEKGKKLPARMGQIIS